MNRIELNDLTSVRPLMAAELDGAAGGLSLLPWPPPRRIHCTRMYPWNRCTDGVHVWYTYSGPSNVMRGRL